MKTPHLSIVLVAPRIAANVGNVVRSTFAMGADLHLVGPFGFIVDKTRLKRSSVGYWESLNPTIYKDAEDFWGRFPRTPETQFCWATKQGKTIFSDCSYAQDSALIFGNEEDGVPEKFWNFNDLPKIESFRIPTVNVRCLNLATSVGIMGFEVLRQWGKQGSNYGQALSITGEEAI